MRSQVQLHVAPMKKITRTIICWSILVLSGIVTVNRGHPTYTNNELNRQLVLRNETNFSLSTYELNETAFYSINISNTSEQLYFNLDFELFSTNDSLLHSISEELSTNIDEDEEYSKTVLTDRPVSMQTIILPITHANPIESISSELVSESETTKTKHIKEAKTIKEEDNQKVSPKNNNISSLQKFERIKHEVVPTQPVQTAATVEPHQPRELTFYVMGDIPYNRKEEGILKDQLQSLPDDASFLVHVGDIQSPKISKCKEKQFKKVRDILRYNSHVPTFIVPGDSKLFTNNNIFCSWLKSVCCFNVFLPRIDDWKDCPKPYKALDIWKENFEKFDRHWSPLPFEVKYQRLLSDRDDKLCPSQNRPENFAFVYENILFVSIHVIGEERGNDDSERKRRHADNAIWLKKNIRRNCRDGIQAVVIFTHKGFKKERIFSDVYDPLIELHDEMYEKYSMRLPIIVIHGNGHKYAVDNPFEREDMMDLQVDQGRKGAPLKVTIDLDFFPYQPKKANTGYANKKGVQYFNMFEFDRRF